MMEALLAHDTKLPLFNKEINANFQFGNSSLTYVILTCYSSINEYMAGKERAHFFYIIFPHENVIGNDDQDARNNKIDLFLSSQVFL